MSYLGTKIKRLSNIEKEVLDFFKENNGFYTAFFITKEIKTKITYQTLTRYLLELNKNKKIKSIKLGRGVAYGR